MLVASIKISHLRVRESGAKFFGLPVHVEDEFRSINSIREAGIIFHQRRGRELPARLPPFQHQRAEVRPRSVNRGSQPGATTPNDNHFLHR